MKPLKQILKESDTLKVRENINSKELVEMVELGLLEQNKLSLLERALNIDAELMTEAEKSVIVDLLNSLIAERSNIFKSIDRQNPYSVTSAGDTQQTKYSSDSKIPVIITFKRRSIRVFPNSVKIALYYSPQLDKYISIPFGGNEAETLGTSIDEAWKAGRQNTKARNTKEKELSPQDKFDQSVNTDPNMDEFEKDTAKHGYKKHGPGVASDYKKNIDRAAENRYNQELARQTKGAWQQAKMKGGYKAGLERIDQNIGDPISNAAAKATHLVKIAGSKAIQGAMKLAGHSVKEETAEETFTRNLAEARVKRTRVKSPKVVKYKPRRTVKKGTRKTKKLGSYHSLFKKSKVKSHKRKTVTPKPTAVKKPKTVVSKPATTSVDRSVEIYKKARRNYDNATPRMITVWDPEKRQKVSVSAREHYKKIFNHHADVIRANGGTLPSIESRRKVKRTPGIKPPPALAEQEQMNEFAGVLAGAAALGLAKKAYDWWKGNSSTSKQYRDKEKEKEYNRDKFTGKRKKDTVGTGTVVGTNRVTPDKSEYEASKRVAKDKAFITDPRSEKVAESNLELLRALAENEEGGKTDVYFDGNTITINSRIARKVLAVYESLNKTNKKNMEKMLDESVSSFRKVINFTIRQ